MQEIRGDSSKHLVLTASREAGCYTMQHAPQVLEDVAKARRAIEQDLPGVAAPLFLKCLGLIPDLLPELEEELVESLSSYSSTLQAEGKGHEALWIYENSVKMVPNSSLLWYSLGTIRYSRQDYGGAITALERAVAISPRLFPALESLENIRNLAVDRWHFRMLNDKARNEAYASALQWAVEYYYHHDDSSRFSSRGSVQSRGPTVLDIGAGTCILGLMAINAGAGVVYACEVNQVLCKLGESIVSQRGLADRIHCINKASYDLTLGPGGDLPDRVDIIVTELVDSGLLGEHILPVLRHAKAHFLKPGGLIIPSRATLQGSLIECLYVRDRQRLWQPLALDLVMGGGDMEVIADEAYTCEDLTILPHGRLTRDAVLWEMDLQGDEDPLGAHNQVTLDLLQRSSQEVDAVATWFNLHLLPSEAGPVACFSTRPRPGCGWDQGLYSLQGPRALLTSTNADSHQVVLYMGVGEGYQLWFSLQEAPPPPSPDHHVTRINETDLARLNDGARLSVYDQALAWAMSQGRHTRAVEWSGNYSLLPGLLLRRGVSHVVSITGCEDSLTTTKAIMGDSPNLQVLVVPESCPPNSIMEHLARVPGGRSTLLVTDVVDSSGLLREGALRALTPTKSLLLNPGALLIPHGFTILVQCINCPLLHAQNRVEGGNTVGVDVGAINAYGVTKFRDVDLSLVQHQALSLPQEALSVELGKVGEEEVVGESRISVPMVTSGRVEAVVFWFRVNLGGGHVMDTGPQHRSSSSSRYHYRQGAMLLPHGGVEVSHGDHLDLHVVCTLSRGVHCFLEQQEQHG